jgi:hypothetical protein
VKRGGKNVCQSCRYHEKWREDPVLGWACWACYCSWCAGAFGEEGAGENAVVAAEAVGCMSIVVAAAAGHSREEQEEQ